MKLVILGLLTCFIIACKSDTNKKEVIKLEAVVESNLGKKLVLPDDLEVYSPFLNSKAGRSMLNSEYKIYSKIDVSCGTCIEHINSWNKLIPEFRQLDIPVILVCGSDDEQFELIKYFCETGKVKNFPYPYLFR